MCAVKGVVSHNPSPTFTYLPLSTNNRPATADATPHAGVPQRGSRSSTCKNSYTLTRTNAKCLRSASWHRNLYAHGQDGMAEDDVAGDTSRALGDIIKPSTDPLYYSTVYKSSVFNFDQHRQGKPYYPVSRKERGARREGQGGGREEG